MKLIAVLLAVVFSVEASYPLAEPAWTYTAPVQTIVEQPIQTVAYSAPLIETVKPALQLTTLTSTRIAEHKSGYSLSQTHPSPPVLIAVPEPVYEVPEYHHPVPETLVVKTVVPQVVPEYRPIPAPLVVKNIAAPVVPHDSYGLPL